MKDKTGLLKPGAYYHLYNRANGSERLFLSDENYRYFLRRYQNFIAPIAHTYCYCLMPNHFHFLIEIKEEEELQAFFIENARDHKTLSGLQDLKGLERSNYLSKKISLQFSHLFNSYTQAFNKQQNRKGSLFMKPFKRLQITDEKYLLNLVRYIHHNPLDAGLCFKAEDWEFSSYQHILKGTSSFIKNDQVIEWFDDKDNFAFCHQGFIEPSFEVLF